MTTPWPTLDTDTVPTTRDTLHGYSKILGNWLKACRPRRKHWWHASLRPSLHGLTTGVVYGDIDFEIELNLTASLLHMRTSTGENKTESLHGQPAAEVARKIDSFLTSSGIDASLVPNHGADSKNTNAGYSTESAIAIGQALGRVAATLSAFRADLPEETSPIQVWPHHFDMSMLWLPGEKIAGQDPDDEENSDKQMNLGFVFGDDTVPEPYFYVTAYPTPDEIRDVQLPAGALWQTEGFTGAFLPYRTLLDKPDAAAYLQTLWGRMVSANRKYLQTGC